MFGAICGDTIGSTYEFDNTKDYGFELFPKGSSYTCLLYTSDAADD